MNLLDLMVKIGVEDNASSEIDGISSGIKSSLGTAAGVAGGAAAAAVAGAVAIGGAALDSFAEYEQLAGGIEKLYGDAAGTVEEFAQQAYRTSGMSVNEYLSNAMQFSAALINSVEGDTQAAAELTDVAMRAISDNVNTFGSDVDSVTNAIIGMSRGNYTMLDNLKLGFSGTAQGMVDLINASGVLGEELTSTSQLAEVGFDQMVEAVQAVQEQQGIAGTTATEAATTIEGSLTSTKAAWDNLVAEFGKEDGDVGARMQELVDSAATFLMGAIDENGERISEGVLGKVGEIFGRILEKAPELLQVGIGLFGQLVNAVAESSPLIVGALVDCIGSLLGIIIESIPAFLASAGNLFVSFVTALTEKREEVMSSLGDMLGQIVSDVGGKVGELLAEAMNLFGQLLVAAGETVTSIPGKVTEIIGAITGGLAGAVTEVYTGAQAVAGQVVAAISSILTGENSVGTKIGKVVSAIMDAFGPTAVSDLLTKAGEVIAQVPSAIGTAVTDVTTKIGEVVSSIVDPISGINLFDIGVQIVNGLIDGIGSMLETAIGAVTGFVGDIVQGAKDLLGIESPSKVFAQIGRYTIEGMVEGIDETAAEAERATARAVKGVYEAASGTVNVTMSARGSDPILLALNAILAAIPGAVYLDSKALVGNLAPEMDRAIGGLI